MTKRIVLGTGYPVWLVDEGAIELCNCKRRLFSSRVNDYPDFKKVDHDIKYHLILEPADSLDKDWTRLKL